MPSKLWTLVALSALLTKRLKPMCCTLQYVIGFNLCARWSTTPVALKATAGLRLLPEEQASNLLNAVRAVLRQYPFKLPKSPVEIMEGSDEGIYGWISVNFLLERLGGDDGAQFSVGCIDLGGWFV